MAKNDINKMLGQMKRQQEMKDDSQKVLGELGIQKEEVEETKRFSVFDMQDAPADWNKYPRIKNLNKEKYAEIKSSIANIGVVMPLLLWQKTKNDKPMVLAGHNRRDICIELIDENRTDSNVDIKKWQYPAQEIIIGEYPEEYIRTIIMDTNIHRDIEDMPVNVRMEIAHDKYELRKKNTNRRYEVNEICEELGIKKSTYYYDKLIYDNLKQELLNAYFDGVINRTNAIKLAQMDTSIQSYILEKFNKEITSEKIGIIKKVLSAGKKKTTIELKEMIDQAVLEHESVLKKKTKVLKVEVPEEYFEELSLMLDEWKKKRGID